MITIISESKDITTNKVIEWLICFNVEFQRSNMSKLTEFTLNLSDSNIGFKINNLKNTKIWIRRGQLNLIPLGLQNMDLIYSLKKEERPLIEFYEKLANEKKMLIGSYQEESLNNKMLNLHIAQKAGFNIPNTIVTNSKEELYSFFKIHKTIITKCLFHPPSIKNQNIIFNSAGTTVVSEKNILFLEDYFMPTLVQKYIDKKYEVRTFFINEEFFSMAIFSQENKKTKIDYRNYDEDKPNRNIPFVLPKQILCRLKKFIKLKGINTGSIDFIVNPNNKFIFLEINPQGQIDWLSKNCNYYIEKKIAMELKKIGRI